MEVIISVATRSHSKHSIEVCEMINKAAQERGTGIAKRDPEYIQAKMEQGNAVIALDGDKVVGFCYIECWEDKKYVANSGLIVHPQYRKLGLAKSIKEAVYNLSKKKCPNSKLFGITTSMAVMKINSELGYQPAIFSELTSDQLFWNGCRSCKNYDILQRTDRKMCLCTGMINDLSDNNEADEMKKKNSSWSSFVSFVADRKLKYLPIIKKMIKNEK